MDVTPYGDRWLLVECADPPHARALREEVIGWRDEDVVDVVPATRTALVACRDRGSAAAVRERLAALDLQPGRTSRGDVVELPVRYDGDDIATVARECAMSVEEVVRRHASATYVAAFCGFAPGFAYLDGLDPRLHVPRLASPRARVPAGSVAIADRWAAVYPRATPGGWRLLGSTEATLWDPSATPPSPLVPGTRVRFVEAT